VKLYVLEENWKGKWYPVNHYSRWTREAARKLLRELSGSSTAKWRICVFKRVGLAR